MIKKSDYSSNNPDNVIKLDTRNVVDVSYEFVNSWEELYRKNIVNKYDNNLINYPQLSLGILANKELNSKLKEGNFFVNHRILIHHHNSGVLRLPLNINSKGHIKRETSSHKWDNQFSPELYIFTVRDPIKRSISHIKWCFRKVSNNTSNLKESIMDGSFDADILPIDRRAAFDILSKKYKAAETIIEKNSLCEWGLELLPELATYQMRYILTLVCSSKPKETMEILWSKSNEDILNIWERNEDSILKEKIGSIYLDDSKKFHVDKKCKTFLKENYQISSFYPDMVLNETSSNITEESEIRINNDFLDFSNFEKSALLKLFNLSLL